FGKYLPPNERSGIVIAAIKAMRDSSVFEKAAATGMLEVIMGDPGFWLADVPKIMSCIHTNLESINMEPARQSVRLLLSLLADRYPTKVVNSLLAISPSEDSSVWNVMLSMPQTLEEILNELLLKLPFPVVFALDTMDACPPHLAPMISRMLHADFGNESDVASYQKPLGMVTLSLLLQNLTSLSETPVMAINMQVLLPRFMDVFKAGDTDVKAKALGVIQNVMAHMTQTEATPIAMELVEELPPLFDNECSQLRERSISLFTVLLRTAERSDERWMKIMKGNARLGLLPLFFRMSDHTANVAEASGEALLAAAELLQWRQLLKLLRTQQLWKIGECLLAQDRSRAEQYLNQSLAYLEDAQASVREAAVRFIGLAARVLRSQEKQLSKIHSALCTLQNDSEASVRSLAAQAISILRPRRDQSRLRRILRALCC
ncbi:Maestro heat-like repeat-containing protein family member 7, partial [Mesitornis unicolor]